MKRMIVVLGLLAVLAASAYAQHPAVNAKVPFEFVASGKTLPAGNYAFTVVDNGIRVRNKDTRTTILAPVLTRIAGSPDSRQVRVSFDVVAGKNFLEAVWPVAGGDGYLTHATKGEHTHTVVTQQ